MTAQTTHASQACSLPTSLPEVTIPLVVTMIREVEHGHHKRIGLAKHAAHAICRCKCTAQMNSRDCQEDVRMMSAPVHCGESSGRDPISVSQRSTTVLPQGRANDHVYRPQAIIDPFRHMLFLN